jgi:Fe-S-cluster containining protein
MPITAVEASRLARRTGMDEENFCNKDESGIRRLLNNQTTKACVFLATESDLPTAAGMCSVYESRPLGCRTYPIVLNSDDSASLDDKCPYNEHFEEPDDDDVHRLLILESKLKR